MQLILTNGRTPKATAACVQGLAIRLALGCSHGTLLFQHNTVSLLHSLAHVAESLPCQAGRVPARVVCLYTQALVTGGCAGYLRVCTVYHAGCLGLLLPILAVGCCHALAAVSQAWLGNEMTIQTCVTVFENQLMTVGLPRLAAQPFQRLQQVDSSRNWHLLKSNHITRKHQCRSARPMPVEAGSSCNTVHS